MTEVQYGQMLERLLSPIGAELGITFRRYSLAAWEQGEYNRGALTYDYDNAFQVTLCVWSDRLIKRCAEVPSPTPIVSADEEASFEIRLKDAVAELMHVPSD